MAKWLKLRLPDDSEILGEPRGPCTADGTSFDAQVHDGQGHHAPGAPYAAILSAAGWPDHKGTVVVVGHQPTLGQTAAWLLSGTVAD